MKKGFTLVELLAVIVILAVILAIAVPGISSVISNTSKSALESDAKLVLRGIEYKQLEDDSFIPSSVNESNVKSLLNIDDSNYQTVEVSTLGGKLYIVIYGKNKWNGLVVYGTKEDMQVVDSDDYSSYIGYNESKGVNSPVLATGMTPIKWSGTAWVTTTEADTDWYNYTTTDKKWANARSADGSMWVWIPRYIYKITSEWHSNVTGTIDVQFSKGIDDNWNFSTIGSIDTGTTSNASNNKWTNHPAFDFGSVKLTGVWVAKFEATAAEGVANLSTSEWSCASVEDNVTTKTVKSIPNVSSWRCIIVGNAFTNVRNMETNSVYGWGTTGTGIDTHLMKSGEWGAVAYLSESNYGQRENEIYANNNQNCITGCDGSSASATSYDGCQNTYDTATGQKGSTTGNIYGVYDLSGGSWEFVTAYVNNGDSNLSSQGSSITSAASQYKDVYAAGAPDNQTSHYALTINQKGDAIYETSNSYTGSYSWFNDLSSMPSVNYPWFIRGGDYSYDYRAGAFVFAGGMGTVSGNVSFRPVLAVNEGL